METDTAALSAIKRYNLVARAILEAIKSKVIIEKASTTIKKNNIPVASRYRDKDR